MANQNITKLPQLPWSALVGMSLLLHVGALSVGLPMILRVDPPPSKSVDIPVTLIDEDTSPVASPQNPSPASIAEQSVQPPTPIGGQNPTVKPQVSSPTLAQQSPTQEITPKKPDTEALPDTKLPAQAVTKPNSGSETANDIESFEELTPENPSLPDNPAEDNSQNPQPESGEGSIAISIMGTSTVPPGTPGDWPDVLPTLQSASTLSVTGNHTCNDALPAGQVTVGLVIAADGSVIQVIAPAGKNELSAQIASCLLTHALSVNPSVLRFTPAYTGQQAIITDRIQLTLQFSAS